MTEKVIIGNATLYHGDCLDILPTLPEIKSWDGFSLITDPPYGLDYKSGHATDALEKGIVVQLFIIGKGVKLPNFINDLEAQTEREAIQQESP